MQYTQIASILDKIKEIEKATTPSRDLIKMTTFSIMQLC
jgi:hypothetical protein